MKKLIILKLACFISYSSLALHNADPCQQENCEQPSFFLTGLLVNDARPVNTLAVDLLGPPDKLVIGSCKANYDDINSNILDRCKRTLKAFARDLCD